MKISQETLDKLNTLAEPLRARVDKIVLTHVQACRRNGFLPEGLDRVFIEAMELVEKDDDQQPAMNHQVSHDARNYHQYGSPHSNWI